MVDKKRQFQRELLKIMRQEVLENNIREILEGDTASFLDKLEEFEEI